MGYKAVNNGWNLGFYEYKISSHLHVSCIVSHIVFAIVQVSLVVKQLRKLKTYTLTFAVVLLNIVIQMKLDVFLATLIIENDLNKAKPFFVFQNVLN
jgi:hypothetical protein